MPDTMHVYIDDKNVIQEIELTNEKKFDQYEHIIIPGSVADEVYDLYLKREEHDTIRERKYVLLDIDGKYRIKNTMYVHYHVDDKSIRSIAPRIQEELTNDINLRYGLVMMNDILEECINGTKSMINYRVNVDSDILILEDKPVIVPEFNFFDSIELIIDYEVKKNNISAIIHMVYDGENIMISSTNDGVVDKKYELFFINKFDKTIFYDSISFEFTDEQKEITKSITLNDNYMVIAAHRNIMEFTEK